MPDVTVKSIDDMEAIYGGLARRARAELGWGMQVFTLPPNWDGYPNHNHGSDAFEALGASGRRWIAATLRAPCYSRFCVVDYSAALIEMPHAN